MRIKDLTQRLVTIAQKKVVSDIKNNVGPLSTYAKTASNKGNTLTLKDIEESYEKIKKLSRKRVILKICSKHWRLLKKSLFDRLDSNTPGYMGRLDGIEVFIQKYLKHPKLIEIEE